jgi:hypothetical protein
MWYPCLVLSVALLFTPGAACVVYQPVVASQPPAPPSDDDDNSIVVILVVVVVILLLALVAVLAVFRYNGAKRSAVRTMNLRILPLLGMQLFHMVHALRLIPCVRAWRTKTHLIRTARDRLLLAARQRCAARLVAAVPPAANARCYAGRQRPHARR